MQWMPFSQSAAMLKKAMHGADAAMRRKRHALRIESLEGRLVLAAPVAVNDSYTAVTGNPLDVAAAGVLANDSDPDGDAIRASLVDNVDHGTLSLQPDGAFTYTPNVGHVGTDTFTYRAQSDPSIIFVVDQSQSTVNVTATLRTEFGNRTSSDSTRVAGVVTTKLTPTTTPFSTAHVTDLSLTLVDPLDFTFNFPLVATITANAAANSMLVTMETPGAPAAVVANTFNQTGNDLRIAGQANVNCSGLACGAITLPPNPQVFDNSGIITDINGTLNQTGSIIGLTFPIAFTGTFDLDGTNFLDLQLSGTVRASGIASPPPDESNLATVTITTVPEIVTKPDAYHVLEDATLAVAAGAAARTETLLPRGSLWRYIDDGSDQGVAWRETGYAETGWKGPVEAEFGYGDGGEGTVIACGAVPANGCTADNYITSYFRRAIELDQIDDIHDLIVRLRRDDGAAVYINGVEVVRDNLAPGAAYNTPAVGNAADDGAGFVEFTVPSNMLVVGRNVVAVEVHQSSATSSDVSFDLELAARRGNLSVLANDVHNAGGTLSASVVTQPQHGTLSLAADGGFTYTPAANYNGPDSFSYRASPTTPPETVTLVVEPVDDKPTAVADGPYTAPFGSPLVVSAATGVLVNDADLEGNALSAVVVSEPANGTLVLAADGSFTYNPTTAADDSFTYKATQNTTLVPMGSRWKFLDNGTDQGTSWTATAFDDAAWSVGVGEFGYGDGGEKTLVGYGTSTSNKYITTYFRKTIQVADAAALSDLVLSVIRDDGVAVYINGTEVGRDNLAAGALFNTLAGPTAIGDAAETTPVTFNVPAGLLVNGANVIAVEMHQQAAGSSDMSFDLQLTGKLNSTPATVTIDSTSTTAAPRVASVEVRSNDWTAAFQQFLQAGGLGDGGFAIPGGASQLAPLPWSNITTIALTFTEPVDPASLAGATLAGITNGAISLADPLVSSGPGGTTFAIWNIAGDASLSTDRYTFALGNVTTTGGVALDGEWTTGASSFPSGNGSAGGSFAFDFRVLPGDVNRDATVNMADIAANVASGFATTADAEYSPFQDVNGSGTVTITDTSYVRNQLTVSVPSPAAAAVVASANRARTPLSANATRRASAVQLAAVDRAISEQAGSGDLSANRQSARQTALRMTAVGTLAIGTGEESTSGIRPRGRATTRSV